MCDIYQDSILTIAASCSASDSSGFLQERITTSPIKLKSSERLKSVCFRPAIDHSQMLLEDPIHFRAWTFQENILPRRLLSFGSREMTWECETHRRCECGQIEFYDLLEHRSDEIGRAAYRKYTRPLAKRPKGGRPKKYLGFMGFYPYWTRILVPEYTRRALSKDSDRLVALQAIAKDLQSSACIGDRFISGLWEGSLVRNLRWRCADDKYLPANNDSPSWSWASIRGPVTPYRDIDFEHRSHIPEKVTRDYDVGDIQIIGADASLVNPRVPCDEIPRASIVVDASALGVLYIKNERTGEFGFHADISDPEHPTPRVPVPLDMEFFSDTPLCCQPDGTLSRSTKSGGLGDHAMTATFLVLEIGRGGNLCVLVCELMPAETRPNTCRRLGIGMVKETDLGSWAPLMRKERFVVL